MKTVSVNTELKAIVSLCNAEPEVQSALLARINTEHFGFEPCKSLFYRIKAYSDQGKPVPKVGMLREDIALDDESKQLISKKRAPVDKNGIIPLLENLDKYRKLRVVHKAVKDTAEIFQQKKIRDIDGTVEGLLDQLAKVRTNSAVNFTTQKNNKKIVHEILFGETSLVETGITAFDSQNGGFPNGGVVIMAASSGGGKSTVAMNLAINQYRLGYSPAILSLEMDEEEMWSRMMSNITKLQFEDIFQKKLKDKQKQLAIKKMKAFKAHGDKHGNEMIVLSPKEDLKFSELIYLVKHKKIDILYIDYISLLKPENSSRAQHEQLGEIARLAKKAAEQMNIPIVLLAQINKEMEIKYSGAIKEHANLVWIWNFDEKAATMREIEIDIMKARNQKKFKFTVGERFDIMSVVDMGNRATGPQQLNSDDLQPIEMKQGVTVSGLEDDL